MQQQQNHEYAKSTKFVSTATCCHFNKRFFIFNGYAFMEFISDEKGTFLCPALSRMRT